jgi:serine/threonine protein kinase
VRGKIGYLSPEQLDSEPLDARTDIYSLGLVMFELVTGRRLDWARSLAGRRGDCGVMGVSRGEVMPGRRTRDDEIDKVAGIFFASAVLAPMGEKPSHLLG